MNLCFDQTFNRKNAIILLDKVFTLNLAIDQYTLKILNYKFLSIMLNVNVLFCSCYSQKEKGAVMPS